MRKPAIITVDDDSLVSAAISRDLRARYGAAYQILTATSGQQALDLIARLALRDQPVALIASDQRMPRMTGIDMLASARPTVPDAKFLLLTAYADTDVAIHAINDIGLDYYLLKPWDPPEERLYPVVDGLLSDWADAHPDHGSDVRIVGHRWSDRSYEIKSFLTRNHVPYRWLDVERDEEAARLLGAAGPDTALPLVLTPDGAALADPTTLALATALGLRTEATQPLYDVCIVGAGPAGLAAAVYAASEGLATVVVEREAPGGQAGQSAAIENYLGFPRGLTGADLAHRALAQANRFGAEMVLAREVTGFETRGPARAVLLDGADAIEARAVIVSTGVSYRALPAAGAAELTGRGVFYGVNASDAGQCAGDDVILVGAGNSAGQAALNLAKHAARVVMVVRGASLGASMSQYLVDRITAAENIEVRLRTEVSAVHGDGHLESVELTGRDTGSVETIGTSWLFVFIGAAPRTDWLGSAVLRDTRGFVVTGHDLLARATDSGDRGAPGGASSPAPADRPARAVWTAARAPLPLETAVPGVFAAGDVRLDSMKRVASAVGEGAMAVANIHQYLALA
jgi:thioredoxin reductase (NADPH)